MPYLLSQLLYCARWIGTLIVLGFHATVQFVYFGQPNEIQLTLPERAWLFFASFELGHHAVIGFFVMSGFLVGGAAIKRLRQEEPFLLDYFIHRVARIYLVLLPAILLTALLDTLGRRLFAGAGVYEIPFLQEHYNPLLIVTDILNLQGVVARYYGTNGPLWSVAYEFWYYILFPGLLLPFCRAYPQRQGHRIAIGALALVAIVSLKQSWFALGLLIWGMGAAAVFPARPFIRSMPIALLINIAVVLALRITISGETLAQHPALQHVSDVISAAAFANLILTLRFAGTRMWPLLKSDMHGRLADFSFSVYAIHMPLLVFMRACLDKAFGAAWLTPPAAPLQWFALACAMGIAVAVAYVFSRLTEANTSAARRILRRFVRRLETAPPTAPDQASLAALGEKKRWRGGKISSIGPSRTDKASRFPAREGKGKTLKRENP
jgi:peptidoglycan/LPS O-acetylase OafA/YrhL